MSLHCVLQCVLRALWFVSVAAATWQTAAWHGVTAAAAVRSPLAVPSTPFRLPRPLVFYAAMELAALLSHVAMTAAGFSCRSLKGITYYTRGLPDDNDSGSIRCARAHVLCSVAQACHMRPGSLCAFQ